MQNTLKNKMHQWSTGFLAIVCVGAGLACFVHTQSVKDYDAALQNYRKNATIEAEETAKAISHSLAYIYQGIRTISLLPSVQSINRHGTNLDTNARESIIQIYNNMASNVAVSEIYIVPVDINPDALDPVTGKNQEPILMFDDKVAAKESKGSDHLEEVEIYEYRLMREQMEYLKHHYPNVTQTERLNLPLISGAEVITCDNTEYTTTKNDTDRSGLVFSVPFYGANGALKGTVSAIIRSNVLKNLIPNTDHAIINQTYHYAVMAKDGGQAPLSSEWVQQGKADPHLLFSAVLPITTAEPQNNWALWVGFPDAKFLESAPVKGVRDFSRMGYGFITLLLLLSAGGWEWQRRNFNAIEVKVGNRTAELGQTVALMNLLKGVATAANEADSIHEGFQTAIDSICAYTGWTVGHAYIFSEEKQKLVSLDVWHLHDAERYAPFKHVSETTELANHEGFLGEVFADSTPMWVLDVADSSIYTRKKIAAEVGLKAAFGFPVFIGRKAVAVIEFYSPIAQIPDETFLSIMGNIGKQLGQTIERAQFQEKALLLETVIQSANDAIVITKAELKNPGPEIIYVNEAFTKISGYTAEEALGKSPRFLQSEFTKQETLDALKVALQEGKPFKDELLNVTKEGKNYWLDISIVPVKNTSSVVTHFAAIERDITAKKEEELKEKNMWVQLKRANMKAEAATRDLQESLEKAEAANKAKGDFLANMSHELRTPMNGVLGMASLLADTNLDDEQQEFVSTINGSAENLLMLLNDILDFSKIEAGALVLENLAFSFTDTLHTTGNLLRSQAEKKAIQLIFNTESDVPAYLWGDPGRVRQIMINLMGNAIKFTERGHVCINASMQEHAGGDRLYVAVEDTGMGIPADKLNEIFEKFTQADASVTRRYGGTGLGLAITKQLVQLMGGEIGVESAEGKGSTFWFTLPCKPANATDISIHSEEHAMPCQAVENRKPIGEAKVLLVDDYHVNRVFAEKLLRKFGFRHIDTAEDGMQAIEKYRTSTYDMIFMDCQMPELDGYQATQKLRLFEDGTAHHTPIIAMTANAMMGDREKCLKAGMDDYLSKPLRAEHLKKVLKMWFLLDDTQATITTRKPEFVAQQEQKYQPVDMEQLRLFTDGDPAEEKALADLFLEQAYAMIVILEQSIAADKNDVWKSAAHRFKGSSGNLGAMALHHLCKRAETHCEDNDTQKLEMLTAIKAETKRVEMFFKE